MANGLRFKSIIGVIFITISICGILVNARAQSPQFTSTPVENGEYGASYQYNITTSPGAGDLEILLTSGDLPAGITLTDFGDGTGQLAGTPTETGSFPIVLTVREELDNASSDTQSFTLSIAKATATVSFDDLSTTYNGGPQTPTVITTPSGLTVDVTYDGSATAPTNAGSYEVVATVNDANYTGSATGTFTINKATATVTLDDLTVTYNGSPQSPTVTTTPSGLTVDVTYDGSATAPTNAGSYEVTAMVNDANYTGSATGTLTINKATATVTLDDLTVNYNGSPQSPTVTTTPSGLTVDVTYDGSATAPTNAGSYEVTATVNDANYTGSATGTFTINKATATVTLDDLTVTYNGSPQSPTVTTTPSGLTVDVTYDGSATAPTNAGSYEVTATVNDVNYSGNNTGTFTINKAGATVTFGSLTATYDGNPKPVTTTTTPAGLGVSITYDGSLTPPTNVGSYAVIATINDPNYTGSASNTFSITKASAMVSLSNTIQTYDGAPKMVTVTTTPSGLTVNITYDGSTTPPTNAGTYAVVATVDDTNYGGSNSGSLRINKAVATVTISNLYQNYDGDEKPVTVTTVPSGLTTTVTYDGSSTVPSAPGSYVVEAIVSNANYSGSSSQVLVINGPPTTSGIPDVNVNEDAANYNIALRPIFADAEDSDAALNFAVVNNTNPTLFTSTNINSSDVLILDFAPDQNGEAFITVRVTDTGGLFVDDEFKVSVAAVQDNPVFTSTPVLGAVRGSNYAYNSQATDPDVGDVLTYSSVVKPGWLTFQDNGGGSGTLSGTPGAGDIGSHDVLLIVTDGGRQAVQEFQITVVETNFEPSFTSTPVTSVDEDELYSYNVTATDPDAGDTPTISVVTKPDWLALGEVDGTDDVLYGTPTNADVGEHDVVLRATDMFGAFDEQSFIITVININDAPEFTSEPVTTATQNIEYTYNIQIKDEDPDDNYTITATTIPSWLDQPVDQGNGMALLSGIPPVSTTNFEEYNVTLIVEDAAGATDEQQFTITVEYQNYPPTLDPIADQGPFNEDHPGTITVPLTGISAGNGETQTLSVTVVSDNENLISDVDVNYTSPEVGGSLSFRPEADQNGVANITVTVQDSGAESFNSISRSFQVTINPVNDKPVFTKTHADQRVRVGEEFSAVVEATDIDTGDVLTITMSTEAGWLTLEDNGNGMAAISGTVPQGAAGTNYLVTVKVTDQAGEFSTTAFTISVNTPPLINNIDISIDEDEVYEFLIDDFNSVFSDTENDNIAKIRIQSLPDFVKTFTWQGTAIKAGDEITVDNGSIKQLIYTPPIDESGTANFTWQAFDGYDWSDLAEVTIVVIAINDAPFFKEKEDEPIFYKQGDGPVPVTRILVIRDIDNQNLKEATINILQEGYIKGEDILQYDNSFNSNITGKFDAQTGEMKLTGIDNFINYAEAIKNVLYENTFLGETDKTEKTISIVVTDEDGEKSEAFNRKIEITEVLPEVDIVSAFTPNNDGTNDYWDFKNLEYYTTIKISVFNDNGSRVFSCSSVDCKWDGTMEGKALPAGSYFYTIDLNNGRRKYQGTVTILK
ncbi:hypothetical protein C900_01982 [Fulvivirga imtechensis AK7]|uniref:Dystroglycan-type cadherin-like domain-containing protein n=1 Tax=Fulvivirga imtechensis AK7 TaxID=1237149 RepID=L8JXN6_9BACT|nr:MBG domain-containing protein [Fulvivirga imtechensis]ELR71987.1 hypothetical protein C900_01982 [Fulvivirga imtechensis AK7]